MLNLDVPLFFGFEFKKILDLFELQFLRQPCKASAQKLQFE